MNKRSQSSNSGAPRHVVLASAAVLEGHAPQTSRNWRVIAAIGVATLVVLAVVAFSLFGGADRSRPTKLAEESSGNHGTAGVSQAGSSKHPLAPALELAETVLKNIQENVHDYTATVIKQERIAGQLSPEEVCFVKIRSRPFSVYMKFLAPPKLKGQEVIFVEGANDGNIIAHAGSGIQALVGTVKIPPQGPLAMLGQRYPITELGIENLTRRLIEVGRHDEQYGETYVWRNDDTKVGDRPCILLTVMHPVRRSGFIFHIARIFVDKELLVPLHYEAYDWPEKPGDSPPLLERYTYTNLKLNPGLTDADFDPNNPEYNFGSK
jgi:hypothetical protein